MNLSISQIMDGLSLAVFDMDGVLFRMEDPLPCADQAVQQFRESGVQVSFLTNNSSKTRADYVAKLARFGITAEPDEIMTSAYATGLLLVGEGGAGKSVYVVGEQGLSNELAAAGLRPLPYSDEEPFDYVVVGWDRSFNYDKLTAAHLAIGRGAEFIATNRDATYPDAGGRTLPGGGTMVAAIRTCAGKEPRVMGKPQPYSLQLLLDRAGCPPDQCLVVGDRLDTDIALGKSVGCRTALVLTGVTTAEQAANAAPEQTPDMVLENLCALR